MIKTIVFDWGGVLTVGRHKSGIVRIISKKYGLDAEKISEIVDINLRNMDRDKLTLHQCTQSINKKLGVDLTSKEMYDILEKAVNPNSGILPILKKLKKNYQLLLLSNNNTPTIKIIRKKQKNFFVYFENQILSHLLKQRKPGKKMYTEMLKFAKGKPSECLFIDDKLKNIKAGRKFGIKGIVYKDNAQLRKALSSFNVR